MYLPFQHVAGGECKELKTAFLHQCRIPFLSAFPLVQPSFHSCTLPNVYLVMLTCHQDRVLHQLAHEHSFPRGFPIVWCRDRWLQYYGFYPKFQNDDIQSPDDDASVWQQVERVHCFKKWSGFLGQLIAFEHDGRQYWSATSKNSADAGSVFVADAERLFAPLVTQHLLADMVTHHRYLCAEMLSFQDQTHGARVLQEGCIVTCIGVGMRLVVDDACNSTWHAPTFLRHVPLVEYCRGHDLPCDSALCIRDPMHFLQRLSECRDVMTDQQFMQLLEQERANVDITQGTREHKQILGQCLEGLVLTLYHRDGSSEVKKYKFPHYTIRTMLFRSWLQQEATALTVSNVPALRAEITRFVQYWCMTKQGRAYWERFALYALMAHWKHGATLYEDTRVGKHIQLCENAHMPPQFDIAEFDAFIAQPNAIARAPHTIVLCIGPIGTGKTSVMHLLCAHNRLLHAIDGDLLDLPSMEEVMELRGERNDYTVWQLVDALRRGQIPVLSTGGGVLFSSGKRQVFQLRQKLQDCLGISVHLVVVITAPTTTVRSLDRTEQAGLVREWYGSQSLPITQQAIVQRVERGEWKQDPKFASPQAFAQFIAQRSKANRAFAEQILDTANVAWAVPYLTRSQYDSLLPTLTNGCAVIAREWTPPPAMLHQPIAVRQLRFLARVTTAGDLPRRIYGHVTIAFHDRLRVYDQCTEHEVLNGTEHGGEWLTMRSTDTDKTFDVQLAVFQPSDRIPTHYHVTIDAGPVAAKHMKTVAMKYPESTQYQVPLTHNTTTTLCLYAREPCVIRLHRLFGVI